MVVGHRRDRNRREGGLSDRKGLLRCSSGVVEEDDHLAWVHRSLLVGGHILRDLGVGRSLHGRVGRTRLFPVRDHSHHRKHLLEHHNHHDHEMEAFLHGHANVGYPRTAVAYRTHLAAH